MRTTWMVAIIAAAVVVCVGGGVGIGYLVWGQRAGEFERLAGELEENLTRSRNALERADREIVELRERQQEITGVVETAGRELSEAVERARTITDLLRSAISAVERLETVTRGGDGGNGISAPP